jgi:hypothetical protein
MNGDSRTAAAITVSAGVFVPLEVFKRRRIDIPVVQRSLTETGMTAVGDMRVPALSSTTWAASRNSASSSGRTSSRASIRPTSPRLRSCHHARAPYEMPWRPAYGRGLQLRGLVAFLLRLPGGKGLLTATSPSR